MKVLLGLALVLGVGIPVTRTAVLNGSTGCRPLSTPLPQLPASLAAAVHMAFAPLPAPAGMISQDAAISAWGGCRGNNKFWMQYGLFTDFEYRSDAAINISPTETRRLPGHIIIDRRPIWLFWDLAYGVPISHGPPPRPGSSPAPSTPVWTGGAAVVDAHTGQWLIGFGFPMTSAPAGLNTSDFRFP